MIYRDKTVLVTGSRRGIGRILTEYFLANGAKVVGFSLGEASFDNPEYVHMQVDVGDAVSVSNAFFKLRKLRISIDILINNAAIQYSQYAVLLSPSSAIAMINTNFLGPFLMSREVSKMMHKKKWGRIVNIGSMLQAIEPRGSSIYTACKSGQEAMAHVLAKELGGSGITVNTIGISAIKTDMLQELSNEIFEEIISNIPISRYAEADDILNVLDFFVSERSSYITGQTIYLGGVN